MTTEIKTTPFSPIRGNVAPLFPIPLYRGVMPLNHDIVAQSIRKVIEPLRISDNTQTNYTTYFHHDIRVKQEQEGWFKDFSDLIKDTYVAQQIEQCNVDFSEMCRDDIHLFAWSNQYKGANYHESHNHPTTLISGTYYVKVEKNAQPIKFFNPNPAASAFPMGNQTAKDYQEAPLTNMNITGHGMNMMEVTVQPTEGEVLMWPSYLYHTVPQSQNDDPNYERISVSFNLTHRIPLDNTKTGRNLKYDFLRNENE